MNQWRSRLLQRWSSNRSRGAVAVEAAILVPILMVPLLLGVLYYGNYFWKAQRVSTLEIDGVPPGSISGTYTCQELVNRVKSLLQGNVSTLAAQLGVPASAVQVVIGVIPQASIGADISIELTVPLLDEIALPLPNNGHLVSELTQRLENVKVTSTSC